ncbi:MAG: type II toxin-antitoxin system HicB family antitoxin [Pseudomonadota bacterium]
MKFFITVLRDEDGVYVSECPSIPGCISQGQTEDEAVENIKEAIIACIKVRSKEYMDPFINTREIDIEIEEDEIIIVEED